MFVGDPLFLKSLFRTGFINPIFLGSLSYFVRHYNNWDIYNPTANIYHPRLSSSETNYTRKHVMSYQLRIRKMR